eukprot:scaffold100174_cov16-Prasinocladus_malaysianus.AAC.1
MSTHMLLSQLIRQHRIPMTWLCFCRVWRGTEGRLGAPGRLCRGPPQTTRSPDTRTKPERGSVWRRKLPTGGEELRPQVKLANISRLEVSPVPSPAMLEF